MALPTWVPEEETKPAPMPLLVLQSYVNTWEGDSKRDLLGDPTSAGRWLADAGLLGEGRRLDEDDLAAARAVRESIRALLVHNGGGPAPRPSELSALAALAGGQRFTTSVEPDGHLELVPEASDRSLWLGALLLIIRDAQRDGTWTRLKACHNDECRWAFYDRSHAVRGAWCDMAVCGNRIKNRNLRSRRAQPGRAEQHP